MKPTQIAINQLPVKQTTSQLLAEKMVSLLDHVRTRAYELFDRRGRDHGYDLDDWLQAESELGALPIAKIEETETEMRIRIERPGFSAGQINVYAEPQAITVEGSAVQTVGSEDSQNRNVTERTLYGRYELPVEVNTGLVTATLDNGVLEIVAGKAASLTEKPLKDEATAAPLKPPLQEKDRSAAA